MGLIISSAEGPDNPFTFTHELVRQTLLAGISAPRRQQLHAAIADTIESLYPTPSKSAPERSPTICSRPDRLLTAGNCSVTWRWREERA